jgi:hypothetical protein
MILQKEQIVSSGSCCIWIDVVFVTTENSGGILHKLCTLVPVHVGICFRIWDVPSVWTLDCCCSYSSCTWTEKMLISVGSLRCFYWEDSIVSTAKSVCVIWVLTFWSVSDTGFLEILPAYQSVPCTASLSC